MAVITHKSTWEHVTQESNAKKGKLVRVETAKGKIVKMYEADAIRLGLLPESAKAKAPAANKMRQPQENKDPTPGPSPSNDGEGGEPTQALPGEGDDFTTIQGIGPATARALKAHGIESFDALRQAGELDYVSPKAMAAIEEWRNG